MIGCWHDNAVCLSVCLSVRPSLTLRIVCKRYTQQQVSEQVNRKCPLIGTWFYNFHAPTPTLRPQIPQPPNCPNFFNNGLWLYRTLYSKDVWTSKKYDRLTQQQLGFLLHVTKWIKFTGCFIYVSLHFCCVELIITVKCPMAHLVTGRVEDVDVKTSNKRTELPFVQRWRCIQHDTSSVANTLPD